MLTRLRLKLHLLLPILEQEQLVPVRWQISKDVNLRPQTILIARVLAEGVPRCAAPSADGDLADLAGGALGVDRDRVKL